MKTKKIASIISFFIATIFAFLPFNFILGSKFACFSYATMAIPSLGYQYSLLYVILYFLTKSLFTSLSPLLFFLHRLPIYFATIALRRWDYKIGVLLPLVAIILFCIHPVGSQVFYYAFYWFIPIGIYGFGKDTIYCRALIASFIAHAVGSVVWLYYGTISSEIWLALIPLVIIERLLIAAGMIGFISLFKFIEHYFSAAKVRA